MYRKLSFFTEKKAETCHACFTLALQLSYACKISPQTIRLKLLPFPSFLSLTLSL